MFNLPDFTTNNRLTRDRVQEIVDALALLLRSGGGQAAGGALTAAGLLSRPHQADALWVQVTGADGNTPPAHSWVQVREDTPGVFVPYADGMVGDETTLPLYDVNGVGFATGSIVRCWRGDGDFYLGTPGGAGSSQTLFASVWSQYGVWSAPLSGWLYPVKLSAGTVRTPTPASAWLLWFYECPPQRYDDTGSGAGPDVNGQSVFYEVFPFGDTGGISGSGPDYAPYSLLPAEAQLDASWNLPSVPIVTASATAPFARIWPVGPPWPPGQFGTGQNSVTGGTFFADYLRAQAGLVVDAPYMVVGSQVAGQIGGVVGDWPVAPGQPFQLYIMNNSAPLLTDPSAAMYTGQTGADGTGNLFVNGWNVALGVQGSLGGPTATSFDGGSYY